MRYATTFSGIGGWELGLNACGWELSWQCEREPFCQALLTERFGAPICPDIHELPEWLVKQFGSIEAASVDVLVGSPPCQPFSVAGEKRGDSDERHLYPQFIRAVSVLKPRWVLMENVPGLLSNRGVFGAYVGGLAALGYDSVWHCIPACAVGANHQRDRIWIVANAASEHRKLRVQHRSNQETGRGNPRARFGRENSVQPSLVAADASILQAWDSQLPEPHLVTVDDGIPGLVELIRGYGNAVIPQIPFLIGQAINEIEGLTCSNKNQT